jgi:hypothetical protein
MTFINKVRLKNFRNFEKAEFDLNHQNFELKADNGFGKSNLADAISWILAGKLFDGSSDIESIKPKNNTKAEVDVEITTTDGITLRKVYQENWQKIRGTMETELRGNATKYYYNGVETTQKAYEEQLERLLGFSLDLVLVFLDPTYFSLKLDWKLRREIINKVVGKVDFYTITNSPIAAKYFLSAGPTITERLRTLLDQHNGRLDATKKTLVQMINKAKKEEIDYIGKIEGLKLITSPYTNDQDYQLAASEYNQLNQRLSLLNDEVKTRLRYDNLKQEFIQTRLLIETTKAWNNVMAKPSPSLCPHCGKIPNEADYNRSLENWTKDSINFEIKKSIRLKGLEDLLININSEVETIKDSIDGTAGGNNVNEIRGKIDQLALDLKKHQAKLSAASLIVDQEKLLTNLRHSMAETEITTDLLSIYVNTLYKIIDVKLKDILPDVKFRLIEPNIKDGSWNEVCDVMDGLVPYDRTNTASQIKIGIKVINGLRDAMNIQLIPLIVDNAEAVVDRKFATQAQVITLVAYK